MSGRMRWYVPCAAALLQACSFAPAYRVPESAPVPPQYSGVTQWSPAHRRDAEPRGDWWSVFADPGLDRLQARLGPSNQSLIAAMARLRL
jgi:outer membrane protein TolC